jgi:signal transduction histidine kinase
MPGDMLEFFVHNPACIPRDAQLQIFNRSFSTKGSGRGLGTYSVKLLAERFLNGKARFQSTPLDGTTFFVSLPVGLADAHEPAPIGTGA